MDDVDPDSFSAMLKLNGGSWKYSGSKIQAMACARMSGQGGSLGTARSGMVWCEGLRAAADLRVAGGVGGSSGVGGSNGVGSGNIGAEVARFCKYLFTVSSF